MRPYLIFAFDHKLREKLMKRVLVLRNLWEETKCTLCVKGAKNILEGSKKYSWRAQKIFLKGIKNIREGCKKYSWREQKISVKGAKNILEMGKKYSWRVPKIFLKRAKNIREGCFFRKVSRYVFRLRQFCSPQCESINGVLERIHSEKNSQLTTLSCLVFVICRMLELNQWNDTFNS